MTTEQRWERIESGWLEVRQGLSALIQSETKMNERIANLDALIRAITAEHSNGKSKH